MSTGNVGGPGQKPTVTTTEPGEQEDVNLKGKLPGGPEVTKEEGATPIQDGSQPQNAGASDIKIDSRKTELTHYFDPTVSQDEDGDGEYDVFMTAVDDPNDFTLFTQDQVNEIEQAALEEAGLSHDEVVESAVGTMKDKSTVMKSFKKVGDMFASAFRKFADVFRPEPKVAEAMAEGIGQLIDVTTADMNEEEAVTATSELISNLESNPNAVLEEIGNKGLTDVIADIKETMRVATKKNLLKMKSMLSESADSFPALQDMSDEARELMINATLSAARLGNPGSTKTDVTQLESRGYIIGKIPTAKLRLVEAILKSSPEFAIEQLKGWLPDTNFGSEIDEHFNFQYMQELLEGNKVEVAEDPAVVPESGDIRTTQMSHKAHNHYEEAAKQITPEKVKQFKDDATLKDVRHLFEDDELKVDENPEGVKVDREGTIRNKRARLRHQTEERRQEMMNKGTAAAAQAHTKKIHRGLQSNELFNAIRNKEADDVVLAQYEAAKAKIVNEGGLTTGSENELKSLQSKMENALQQKTEDSALLTRAILVANKLAAWTDPTSSDAITWLGSVAVKGKYSDTFDTAMTMAEQDIEELRGGLLQNTAVKHSDFANKLTPDAPNLIEDEE